MRHSARNCRGFVVDAELSQQGGWHFLLASTEITSLWLSLARRTAAAGLPECLFPYRRQSSPSP
jgi:hypothetical protein